MELKQYLKLRIEQAADHDVSLVLHPQRYVTEAGAKWTGVFDSQKRAVELARQSPHFWPVMIHEFCHMDQWIAQIPEEKAYMECRELHLIEDFFNGKIKLTREKQLEVMRITRALEFDCEKRVIAQVQLYDLPIDIPHYIQQSNAYMYYHAVMFILGGFHTKASPARTKRVYEAMPTEFLQESDYDNPPVDFILRCKQYCYK